MIAVFTWSLLVATALIAIWIAVRFPGLAPASMTWRGLGLLASAAAVQVVPIWTDSTTSLWVSVFGLLAPALVAAWLCAAWLLQALVAYTAAR